MATANIYFDRGRFDDADYHYTLLRREYPRSELQFEAHLLGLQAKLRKYQGEDYDGTPLEEAKTLVKQLRSQFAGRLSTKKRSGCARSKASSIRKSPRATTAWPSTTTARSTTAPPGITTPR